MRTDTFGFYFTPKELIDLGEHVSDTDPMLLDEEGSEVLIDCEAEQVVVYYEDGMVFSKRTFAQLGIKQTDK
jgi:hypothetical protein